MRADFNDILCARISKYFFKDEMNFCLHKESGKKIIVCIFLPGVGGGVGREAEQGEGEEKRIKGMEVRQREGGSGG